jgi:plastocyanin
MVNMSYGALAFVAALDLILGAQYIAAADAPRPAAHKVTIEGMRFRPEVLTVEAGDSILWVNKDPFPHTVTSRAGDFDSHEIGPGESWTYTARTGGEFPYICRLHPTMRARLRVE